MGLIYHEYVYVSGKSADACKGPKMAKPMKMVLAGRPKTARGDPGGTAAAVPSRPSGAPALADQARAQLEEMIVKLELQPGSVWSESELSHKLGIGRTPVREALQRLQSEYLVKIVPRYGAQITEINVTQQLLLLEVRRELERLIAVNAARRSTTEEREQLLQMADTLEGMTDGDVLRFLRYHYDIKKFIAACARNPFAASAIAACHAMSRRFYYLHYRRTHDMPVAAKYHADVIRAIASGDEAKASATSEVLMDYVVELTRATVTQKF